MSAACKDGIDGYDGSGALPPGALVMMRSFSGGRKTSTWGAQGGKGGGETKNKSTKELTRTHKDSLELTRTHKNSLELTSTHLDSLELIRTL